MARLPSTPEASASRPPPGFAAGPAADAAGAWPYVASPIAEAVAGSLLAAGFSQAVSVAKSAVSPNLAAVLSTCISSKREARYLPLRAVAGNWRSFGAQTKVRRGLTRQQDPTFGHCKSPSPLRTFPLAPAFVRYSPRDVTRRSASLSRAPSSKQRYEGPDDRRIPQREINLRRLQSVTHPIHGSCAANDQPAPAHRDQRI